MVGFSKCFIEQCTPSTLQCHDYWTNDSKFGLSVDWRILHIIRWAQRRLSTPGLLVNMASHNGRLHSPFTTKDRLKIIPNFDSLLLNEGLGSLLPADASNASEQKKNHFGRILECPAALRSLTPRLQQVFQKKE